MASKITLVGFEPHANKAERRRFIDLAWKINARDPAWVPPLRLSVEDALDTKKNPFYKHARIQLWNAYREGEHVGRISACVDDRHNEFHGEKIGFWGFFECIDDASVASALFAAAEDWIRGQGMNASRGPANPSFNHEAGMLLNSFSEDPYVMMTHNLPYFPALVEGLGYQKEKDLFAFNLPCPEEFDARVVRISEKVKAKNNITIRSINMKKFREEVQLIREIYNAAWEKNWGFVPMDQAEFDHMAKSLKDVLWPDFCLLAFVGDKPIGFSLALPDINRVLKRIPNGKLLPFGIFTLLNGLRPAAKVVDRVRVITLGVVPEWRASGVASVFYYESYRRAKGLGLWGGEASWILEDNREMLSAIQVFGKAPPYKTYRVYQKGL